jgi:hypothetical protein
MSVDQELHAVAAVSQWGSQQRLHIKRNLFNAINNIKS